MGVFDNEGYSRFGQRMDEAQAFSIVYGAFPIAKKNCPLDPEEVNNSCTTHM